REEDADNDNERWTVRLSAVHDDMALPKKSKIRLLERAVTSKTLQGVGLDDLIAKSPVAGSTGLF
ncbi:hypothetical protein, partial [Escherichia coli]|uniref:hypothetical protein n=1 Tax=Escherichia coli TaxID=562 RepID=UPI001BD57DAC